MMYIVFETKLGQSIFLNNDLTQFDIIFPKLDNDQLSFCNLPKSK